MKAIVFERKKYRLVKKLSIDRNTPVGEPADFYEVKPYGGLKPIPTPIAQIDDNGRVEFTSSLLFQPVYKDNYEYIRTDFVYDPELINFIKNL